jgi:ferredoxin
MSIKTSRAAGTATVTVDDSLCTACGACVRVCYGDPLVMDTGRVRVDQSRLFGCIACGACVAACPTGAIRVEGRDLAPDDVLELAPREDRATYDQLLALLRHRRSVRDFTRREVPDELVDRILEAASTAPMGVPPSDVGVLVLNGRDRVRAFSEDALAWMLGVRGWLRPVLPLTRPFVGRDTYVMFRDFIIPAVDAYEDKAAEGTDWLMYDAPLALFFYGCGFNDPADPYIPATLAVVAAESLGLGSCMLGFAGYPAAYSRAFRQRWGLPRKILPGIVVVFGYPAVGRHHAVRRRFARVDRGA